MHRPFVDVARHTFITPQQADKVGVVLLRHSQTPVDAAGLQGYRIDEHLAFTGFQAGFHGIEVGGIQRKHFIGNSLDGVYHPGHQFVAPLAGGTNIKVDKVDAGRSLLFSHFLNRRRVSVFKGRAEGL